MTDEDKTTKFKAYAHINRSTIDKTDLITIEAGGDTKKETLELFKAIKKEVDPR